MKKLSAVALAAGLLTSACGGHGGQSPLPSTAQALPGGAHTSAVIVAPSGWASTSTLGAAVANASDVGALAASTPLTVRVALGVHNADSLAQAIAAGQRFSDAQLMATYAPTSAEVSQVVSYLQAQGFTNVDVAPNHLLVSADGTAAKAQTAFNTSLHAFSLGGKTLYANVSPAFVPASLGGIAVAVLGLNNAARVASSPTDCFPANPPPGGVPCVRSYDAKTIQTFYDAGSTPTASNTTIAVMAEGDVSQTVSDLALAEQQQGLPQVPVVVKQVGLPSPDTAGIDEWDLDTQSSTGIAGTVKTLYLYHTTSLTDSDIANEYSHWESDNLAQTGNSSFGECEYQAWLDGSMKADDNVMMFAAAHGQTMFASSGDTGSSCALVGTNGVPGSGPPMVEFPAASPWIIAVGGTTLTSNPDGTYDGEVSWNAGGGGLSQFENATSWMEPVQLTTGIVAAGNLRGVPDIAAAGDPNAGGYLVWANPAISSCGNPCGIGGTSEASPLSMGMYARMLSTHPGLGFAGPHLYANYQQYEGGENTVTGPPPYATYGGFHDIIAGVNGAYSAAPGYDYTTGLGTFDISALNQTIH